MSTIRTMIVWALGLVLLPQGLSAEEITKNRGTTVAQFLKIGPGARAAAMGEAFSAVASDVSAVYWNPAGAASLQNVGVFVSHINWLADIDYNFFAAVAPIGYSGTVGVFATSVNVPEDKVRTVAQPDGTGERFDAADMAIGASYSRQISESFSFGIVGKYIQSRIWTMTASAVAIDIGTLYKSRWRNLRIGITMSNFGTPMKLVGRANLIFADAHPFIDGNIETIRAELEMEKWELPLNVKTSISTDLLHTQNIRVITAVDMVHPNDNLEYFNGGAEVVLRDMFSLRAGLRGYNTVEPPKERDSGITFGGGLSLPLTNMRLAADYAYTNFGRLKYLQQVTFSLVF